MLLTGFLYAYKLIKNIRVDSQEITEMQIMSPTCSYSNVVTQKILAMEIYRILTILRLQL